MVPTALCLLTTSMTTGWVARTSPSSLRTEPSGSKHTVMGTQDADTERSGTAQASGSDPLISRSPIPAGDRLSASPAVPNEADFTTPERALKWSSVLSVDFITERKCLSRVTYLPGSAAEGSTGAADKTNVPQQMQIANIRTEATRMANTHTPLVVVVEELQIARVALVRHFAKDGTIDEEERYLLELHDSPTHRVAEYQIREEAADSFKRNGWSRVTRDRFKDAGYGLVDLEEERKARPGSNVVQFQTRKDFG